MDTVDIQRQVKECKEKLAKLEEQLSEKQYMRGGTFYKATCRFGERLVVTDSSGVGLIVLDQVGKLQAQSKIIQICNYAIGETVPVEGFYYKITETINPHPGRVSIFGWLTGNE